MGRGGGFLPSLFPFSLLPPPPLFTPATQAIKIRLVLDLIFFERQFFAQMTELSLKKRH